MPPAIIDSGGVNPPLRELDHSEGLSNYLTAQVGFFCFIYRLCVSVANL